jgi:hypothetical protein
VAAGPAGADRAGEGRGIARNKHTKHPHSEISAQFYVVRPRHDVRLFAAICYVIERIWPFNGQTTPNRAKMSPPLRFPLDLSPDKKFLRPNGFSRRTRLSHKVLPTGSWL